MNITHAKTHVVFAEELKLVLEMKDVWSQQLHITDFPYDNLKHYIPYRKTWEFTQDSHENL